MDFDKWWAQQPKDPTKPITPRMAWDAATKAEREACAKLCDELPAPPGTTSFSSYEVATMDCGEAIRMRANVENY